MSRAKNVIDMRASKGFSPSQGNEHLRRLDDCKRAQKARWNKRTAELRSRYKPTIVKRIEKRAFLRRKISHEKFGCYSIFSYLCKRDAKASIRTTALRRNCKVDTHELRKFIRSTILQGCPIE